MGVGETGVNQSYSKTERSHLERVKSLPCSVCNAPPPSAAHHMKPDSAFYTIALCYECHQGKSGIHGDRAMWRVMKLDEVDALVATFRRLL